MFVSTLVHSSSPLLAAVFVDVIIRSNRLLRSSLLLVVVFFLTRLVNSLDISILVRWLVFFNATKLLFSVLIVLVLVLDKREEYGELFMMILEVVVDSS